MKFLTFAFTLALTTSAFADSFNCQATIDMTKSKKIISLTDTSLDIEGLDSKPILEVVRAEVNGKAVKKCANKSPASQYKCMDKLVPKAKEGDSKLSLHNLLLQVSELEPDNKEAVGTVSTLDITTKADINVSEVTSGVVYVTKFGTYYPNSGIYEFFNAEGKSLGRIYQDGLPRNCR